MKRVAVLVLLILVVGIWSHGHHDAKRAEAAGGVSVSATVTNIPGGKHYQYSVTNTSSSGFFAKAMRYAFKGGVVFIACTTSSGLACAGVGITAIALDPAGTLTNQAVIFEASNPGGYMAPGASYTFSIDAGGESGTIEYLYEFSDGSYVRGFTTGSVGSSVAGVGGAAELPPVASGRGASQESNAGSGGVDHLYLSVAALGALASLIAVALFLRRHRAR